MRSKVPKRAAIIQAFVEYGLGHVVDSMVFSVTVHTFTGAISLSAINKIAERLMPTEVHIGRTKTGPSVVLNYR